MLPEHVAGQHVALLVSGNMVTVTHNIITIYLCHGRLVPLYPATDGQQTGNNFVADNKQHVDGNRQHEQHVALV